jgi:DNA-binding transcriptional ArsR family regulator
MEVETTLTPVKNPFTIDSFSAAGMIIRAFDHKLRRDILDFLWDGKKTVTEIFIHFRMEQSVASQHLAILRKQDLVETERDGKFIYYTVNKKRFNYYKQRIEELIK